MAKNLRDIVKKNPTPAKPRFGVDPSNPWSAKAGIYEAGGTLDQFLSSRGINPKFVSKDTKISHAKSSAFLKWKQDHTVEEVQLDEDKWLNRFLSSRGIDPKFVTTDKKVSYSKSGEFAKWLRDHKPDERLQKEEQIDEVSGMGIRSSRSHEPTQADHDTVKKHLKNLMAIHSDEPSATPAVHRAIRKMSTPGSTSTKTRSKEMLKALIQKHSIPIDQEHRALLNREQVEQNESAKPTSLQKFRKAAAEREKKHAEIEKQSKEKPDMKGAIDRLEKHLNKEAADAGVSKTKETQFHKKLDTLVHSTFGKRKDEMKKEEVMNEDSELSALADKHGWSYKRNTYGAELHHPKHGSIGMDRYGHWYHHTDKKTNKITHHGEYGELSKHLSSLKEEVEQIDEISKSTLASYKDKSTASLKNAQTNRDAAEAGKHMSKGFADLHAKSDATAKKRVKGLIGYMQRKQGMKPTSEDVFHDTQAATQMPSDGANNTDDTSPMKRERSKSARMIKSLYKSKNMKEDMYDWEKDDKSTKGYGKKPKMTTTDKKESYGENKPEAVAIMTGGKTLTGQDRDTVEIDPSMKKRPNQPDAGPQDGSKQDRK